MAYIALFFYEKLSNIAEFFYLFVFIFLKRSFYAYKLNTNMKKVLKNFKNHRHLCFLDFEGTQFSHEMIAYGAVLVTIDKEGRIVKQKPAIKKYVRAKNAVGKYVENLTGITRLDLDRFGVPFSTAIKDLKKYCGLHFKGCSFLTFGNHDIRILNQSISYNLDAPKDLCQVIKSNYVDFQAVISEFIKDDHNNPYSLTNYLNVFGVEFDGTAHDPEYDALNLVRLYDAFMKDVDIVEKEFFKNMKRCSYHPEPVDRVIKDLLDGKTVSPEDFKKYIDEYIA